MMPNMKQKISPLNTNLILSAEAALEKVKKLIDAQIDFNKNLMKSLLSSNNLEVCEILISMYADLSHIPKLNTVPKHEMVAFLKQTLIKNIIVDIQSFNKLQQYAISSPDLEYLFLKIHCDHQVTLSGLKQTSAAAYKEVFSFFYSGLNLKKIIKHITKNLVNKNSAVFVDVNVLSEMLTLLTPHVGAHCLHFQNKETIAVNEEGYSYILKKPLYKNYDKQIAALPSYNPYYPDLNSLLAQYIYIHLRSPDTSKNFSDNYLSFYENQKSVYQLEEQIENMLKQARSFDLNAKKENENQLIFNKSVQLLPKTSEKERLDVSTLIINNADTKSIDPVSINREKITAEFHQSLNVSNGLSIDAGVSSSESSEIQNGKKELVAEDDDVLCNSYAINHYGLFSKNYKKESEKTVEKYNTLNLNKEHEDTFKKVFNLIPYDYIKLRALVNLALALGATIKTTGANRCRIEIKNIYANLLVNESQITKSLENANVCDKATVTMHGGGHRSTRSQNNDADKAPQYLINQFQAAFTRAGFTPESLGLNHDNEKSQSIKY